MGWVFDIQAWTSLITLSALEIVLGIDNIVVLALLTAPLDPRNARPARRAGLLIALGLRLALLAGASWMASLTSPALTLAGVTLSWRDLLLTSGGVFLVVTAIQELHEAVTKRTASQAHAARPRATVLMVVAQIAVMDLIFSLDSIAAAIGISRNLPVMAAAITISMFIMYASSNAVSVFMQTFSRVKTLGLCFLALIGAALIAEGFGFAISQGSLIFAIAFAFVVETINILIDRNGASRSAMPLNQVVSTRKTASRQSYGATARPPSAKASLAAAPMPASKRKRRRRR